MTAVYRQEVWTVDLNPPGKGREIHGYRPALVVSVDELNNCLADMVVVVPLTTTDKKIPLHVKIQPPEGSVKKISFAKCDQIRTISKTRLKKRLGHVSRGVMGHVEAVLRILLGL